MQFLYVIKGGDYCKIGITSNVENRIYALQTANAVKIVKKLVFGFNDARPVEKVLHSTFGSKRLNREWFMLDEKDITKIRQICNACNGTEIGLPPPTPSIEEPDVWRMQKHGHGKYKGRYYRWVKIGDPNRTTLKGGLLPEGMTFRPYNKMENK